VSLLALLARRSPERLHPNWRTEKSNAKRSGPTVYTFVAGENALSLAGPLQPGELAAQTLNMRARLLYYRIRRKAREVTLLLQSGISAG